MVYGGEADHIVQKENFSITKSRGKTMQKKLKYLLGILLLIIGLLGGCQPIPESALTETVKEQMKYSEDAADTEAGISESGEYTSKEDVSAYLHTYGHLPDNFITKKEAKALGWVSKEGNLAEAAPGKSIGGDHFGNYEGSLPEEKGRTYYECDIDADGGYRGAKRIIYSNDGLIYYTGDHYETFELLYGED